MRKFTLLLYSLTCFCVIGIKAQNIHTVAGDSTSGYNGDGILATAAKLDEPKGVAVDAKGNIYIVDALNFRIREVNVSTGIISTVAGIGSAGYNGDGILATTAKIGGAANAGIAFDTSGNFYIADAGNNRIRKVTISTGIISTVAGNGTSGYSGDGGAATSAELYGPTGVAIDAKGNIYISDFDNQRIRKVTASTGLINTVAGTGVGGYNGDGIPATSADLNAPFAILVDANDNLYIDTEDSIGSANQFSDKIRKVTASTGLISTIAGDSIQGFSGDGGLATSAELYLPHGIALDAKGNLYIADASNHRIREVSASTGIINTIAGDNLPGYNGDGIPATSAELFYPIDVTLDANGNIYIADELNERIRKVDVVTGINEITENRSINLYPNPNHGIFTISLENIADKAQIEIYNVLGEKVCNSTVNKNTARINMNIQAAGVYLYRVLTENGTFISSGKFIIE